MAQAPDGQDKRTGAYRGVYLGGDESLTSPAWITEHVKENHGPLGALYPMTTYTEPRVTVWRWRPAFQNDFAARMDWYLRFAKAALRHAPDSAVHTAEDYRRRSP